MKDYGRAADYIAQRMKALERAMVDRHWKRAQAMELISQEGAPMMEQDEDMAATREAIEEMKMRKFESKLSKEKV